MHAALALIFGAVNPPFEAHDETGHFAYVTHLATRLSLPNALDRDDDALFDQSHQPPLYYVAVAALTGWLPRDTTVTPRPNVFAFDGTNRRGARMLLRDPGESPPWPPVLLALHAARAVSALLGGALVLVIAATARRLFGDAPAAWLTGALAAFNPQVVFMSSMVNNDVMAALAGAAVALVIVHVALAPDRAAPTSRAAIALGVALGAGVVSKNNSLALVPFAGLALAFLAWRGQWGLRAFARIGALTGLAFAVVAGPYLAFNCVRYGGQCFVDRNPANPLIQQPTAVIGEGIGVALRDAWLPQIFVNAFRTFWGAFGWGNVQYPDWVYGGLAALCIAGVAGFAMAVRREAPARRDALLVLAGLGAAMTVLPLYRAVYFQTPALMPGRYLMPGLTAYAAIVGCGWASIANAAGRRDGDTAPAPAAALAALMSVGLVLLSIATPFTLLRGSYTAGVIAASDGRPALITFDDVAQVTNVHAEEIRLADREGLRPYARVKVTWRVLRSVGTQLVFGLSVLGRDQEVLGNMTRFPARGNYPSTNWRPGDTWEETFDILLEKPCAALPALGRVSVSVFEAEWVSQPDGGSSVKPGRALAAHDANGAPTTPILGRFRISEGPDMAVHWQPALAMFDGIGLRQVDAPTQVAPGRPFTVALTYEVWRPTSFDAKAFVHAVDDSGAVIAQDDHTPQHGSYPTDFWRVGECVTERFELTLPNGARGAVRLLTGFYDENTRRRLSTGTSNDVHVLGQPAIVAR